MRVTTLLGGSLFAFALPFLALADAHGPSHARRHHELALRPRGDIQKRFDGARLTFYDITVGLTACGNSYPASAHVVALNSAQFGGGYPGPNCFKMITLTVGSKSTQAQIVDECPGCPFGGLDLTEGLFTFFADESVGVLTGSWTFDGEGAPPPPPPPPKTTAPPPPPPPPPTTHKEAPKPTSSPPPPPPPPTTTHTSSHTPSTTSHSTTPSSSSTSKTSSVVHTSSASSSAPVPSVNVNSGVASGLAVATGTVQSSPSNPQIINNANLALINLGGLIVGGLSN
ncbi:hypothetical protein BV25DRAFT_1996130 [Artomyces pyxidatus]|uniref:Uncharacterized protein n=1 Tax=Artomyces pyxidatus TaxID=48021 RepID=A0ACB8SI92_9AGAM|nr:hypothetical protein BV25DRAFT_1996130 [Artomyces pyxidatus]